MNTKNPEIKLYQKIAILIEWNPLSEEFQEQKTEEIKRMESHLLHGSGFDAGTKINMEKSKADKLIVETSFHHMDSNGYYCGWSNHIITIAPSLAYNFNLDIESDYSLVENETLVENEDGNLVPYFGEYEKKSSDDYISDVFYHTLEKPIPQYNPKYFNQLED